MRIRRDFAGLAGSLLLVSTAALTSCSDTTGENVTPPPPPPCGALDASSAATLAINNLDAALRNLLTSLTPLDDSAVMGRLLAGGQANRTSIGTDGLPALDDLRTDLRDHVFTPDNVESQTDSAVTFLMRDPCENDGGVAGDGGASSSTSSCSSFWRTHEVRLRVSRIDCDAGDNVRVEVLVTPQKKLLVDVQLLANKTVAIVDLSQGLKDLVDDDDPEYPVTVSPTSGGRVQLSLEQLGTAKVHALAKVLSAVSIDVLSDDTPTGFGLAAGDRVFELTAAAATRSLTAHVGLGAMRVIEPLSNAIGDWFNRSVVATVPDSDTVRLDLAGLGGDLAWDGATDRVTLTGLNLGTGTSKLTHGADTLLKIDVNATHDRRLDVEVTGTSDNGLAMAISPELDLSIVYSMASVNALVTNLEKFALGETLRIRAWAAAGARPAVRLPVDFSGDLVISGSQSGALLMMTSGTLDLTSQYAPSENVSVPVSSCLVRTTSTAATHEFLSNLDSATCN